MFLAWLAVFASGLLTHVGSAVSDRRNLLQVHSDKRDSVQPAVETTVDSAETTVAVKASYPYYHTSAELLQEAKLLSKGCDGMLTIETRAEGNVSIDVMHVRSPRATPINRVFMLFGEHSRELISPESGLQFLKMICGKVESGSKVDISAVLLDSEFQLVLNGNPHSREKVEKGNYCLRTNPNGVDLNRNWDEMWAESGQGDLSQQTNGGSKPFSEPETRIFKKLAEEFEPTTFLTVHSGTKGMYMPWAYDLEHEAKFNAPLMLSVLKSLDQSHCQCPYGAAGKEVGYPCPGTCLDWVYSKLKTPYVFAFEIYTSPNSDEELKRRFLDKLQETKDDGSLQLLQSGNHLGRTSGGGHLGHMSSSQQFARLSSEFAQSKVDLASMVGADACFGTFNPDTEERYNTTVKNWAGAYLEMAHMIAQKLKKEPQ